MFTLMQAFMFFVSEPKRTVDGTWRFSVASVRMQVHGPFATRAEADRFRGDLARRWRARAEALEGSFRVEPPDTWVVTVPEGTPVIGLRWHPPEPEAVSARRRKGHDPHDDPPLPIRLGPWKIV